MAITTSVARHYAIRMNVVAVLCVLFGVWGAYDLWVKIPREEAIADRFEDITAELIRLGEVKQTRDLTDAETQSAVALTGELVQIAPGGKTPARPATFDRLTCWFFIACFPMAPYFYWRYRVLRSRVYRLDDDGTLTTPEATWSEDEIAGIDMSRWMAKSIAMVEHRDGAELKLDAYLFRNLQLIVGAIAARFHPEHWDEEAKPVKTSDGDDGDDGAGNGEPGAESGVEDDLEAVAEVEDSVEETDERASHTQSTT